jgi:hypothetical protein
VLLFTCFCQWSRVPTVLATVNGGMPAEQLISIDMPSCFRLANPQPITPTPNCFTGPCSPLIEATMLEPGATRRCEGGSCLCPFALSAGSSCLQCLATVNPVQLSGIAEIVTSCQVSFPTGATSTASSTVSRSSAPGKDVPRDIWFKSLGLFTIIFSLFF